MKTPPYLIKGDKVAIVAPAGKIKKELVNDAKRTLENWGLCVVLGKNVYQEHFQYAATDKSRLSDLQKALDDNEIKAIFCARGGYGLIRIMDDIDFSNFKKMPKWIIGFSDITILHAHIHSNFGIETLHATMAAGLKDELSANTLRNCLFGQPQNYELKTESNSRQGRAAGRLVGGNLAILCSLIGTPSDMDTTGKILFIEDIGEYLYRLDRMMWQLKRADKLKNLAGLVVGGFTDMKDNDNPFGKSAYEIITEAVEETNYPVCFGFPSGHQQDNRALFLGRSAILSINQLTTLNFEHRTISNHG
ncbi:MAG: LD-carboxypeptidase [Bacteroidales bacterium]